MYILNIRRVAYPAQVYSYKAPLQFPSINPGHFISLSNTTRAEVKQVKHSLLPTDWVTDVYIGEPIPALTGAEGGSTNPVPWPKSAFAGGGSTNPVPWPFKKPAKKS